MRSIVANKDSQFYQMLLKAPSAVGMLRGANHVFELANPLFLELTGRSNIIGKTMNEVFPEVMEQGFGELLDNVYYTGESFSGKEMYVRVDTRGDGEFTDFYIDVVYQAYRDSEGNIEGVFFFINNLTEQVVSKKKIEKSEIQYRRIVETAQEGIWLIDEHAKTTFVNKKMCDLLKYSESEIMDKTCYHFMDAEQRDQALHILNNREAKNYDCRFITKSGAQILTKVGVNPIFDDDGNFKGSLKMVSDITERKHLEKLLEKTNKLARIGSWEIDVKRGTVYWSDVTKEIREVEPDFVPDITTGISYFTKGQSRTTISQRVQECIEKGTPWDEELQFKTFKGNLKWVRTIGQAIFSEGECIKIYGTFQDITERKNAVDKVLRSEAKLKIAQTIAQVGSWEVDILSNQHTWSDEIYRILGIDKDLNPSAENFLKFVHPEDREMASQRVAEAFVKHEDSSFYFQFYKEDGTLGYALTQWRFEFDAAGVPLYISGILRDLTKEKKAENERLKMIANLHQRNNDLEQFSFIISHNLRSPVANIIGLTKELKDFSHSEQVKQMLGEALISDAHRLEDVIADLNTILQTKSENSQRRENVVFSELTQSIELSIFSLIQKEKVTIKTDFTQIDSMNTIKSYLQSVFFNLISNSIKFKQPTVDPVIEISSTLTKDKIILTFKDNGSGIDLNKKRGQLFKLYKRFHANTEGKGMGLFMVKTQVETLGGIIEVRSKVNCGTVFTIEFNRDFTP